MDNILKKPIFFGVLALLFTACLQSGDSQQQGVLAGEADTVQVADATGNKKAKKMTITDQTLNMPMGTMDVPAGWQLHQDIASNPNGSGYLKFLLALENPEGEIHGFLPFSMDYITIHLYGQETGMGFEQVLTYLMRYCSQPFLEKFSPGFIQSDQEALMSEKGKPVLEFANSLVTQSMNSGVYAQPDADVVNMDFTAFRKSIPYKGRLEAAKMGVAVQYDASHSRKFGIIMGGFRLAPEPLFEKALSVNHDDLMQFQMNAEWDQKRMQIMQRGHEDRMAQQQQQFAAHQKNMAAMRQSFDSHNQAWRNRNFGSSGASSYSGNAAVTDAITGYTSFNDPHTGHQIKKEGHYDYWYTNEFGEYHGTNDPNFQPGKHYSGDWKPIQPLKPDH